MGKHKKVVINGIVYSGFNEASRKLGISEMTIANRVKSDKPLYVNWYYDNGNKPIIKNFNLIFEKELPSSESYIIDGDQYYSKEEVLRKFNITSFELDFRVESEVFKEWKETNLYESKFYFRRNGK